MPPRDSHCSFCGAPHTIATWPRTCPACGNVTYKNPLPVAVLVLPVDAGVLIIRRNIPPAGKLALPGGFIDYGESWQHAAARELREEAQIVVAPATITLVTVKSAPDSTLLVFGEAPPMASAELPAFVPNAETQERLVITEPIELAFSTHTEVLRGWFARR